MTRRQQLEIYNFTLTFGESHVLLDLAEEIALPAFLSDFRRNFRNGQYFFHEVQVLELDNYYETQPALCLAGRFIKDTQLKREQRYEQETDSLIEDEQTLQSSPSSIFVLILNEHRLLYLRETSYAPPIAAFQATVKEFVSRTYRDFLNNLYDETQNPNISGNYPPPELEILPLSSSSNLRQFIEQYETLESVEVRFVKTNSYLDNDPFLRIMRERRSSIEASVTVLRHENKTTGLDKEAAIAQTQEVASQANSRLKFRGRDKENNILVGSNEDLKIQVPVQSVPDEVPGASERMVSVYKTLLEQKTVMRSKMSESADSISQKLRKIRDRFIGG
jgi:hypothetical protein